MDLPDADQQLILSVCSGGGGLDLGVRLAVPRARTVGYVEIEIPAAACLVSHMEAGTLDPAPLWTNLRTFNWRRFRGAVDGLIGGYPCQPFSIAGKQRGVDDPRHLWPLLREGIPQCQPAWCLFENVANHLNVGFDVVARELQELDYDVAATLLTASEVGATHKRERLFILAHRKGFDGRLLVQQWRSYEAGVEFGGRGKTVVDTERIRGFRTTQIGSGQIAQRRDRDASETHVRVVDADHAGSQGWGESIAGRSYQLPTWPPSPEDDAAWAAVLAHFPDLAPAIEPSVRGVAHGVVPRVDRLRLLGNGVVPLQAALAFRSLAEDLGWV